MTLATILKQPAEVLRQPMTFSGVATIQALLSIDTIARGIVPGSDPLDVEGSLFADALTLSIGGGTDGERYLITVRATDADGREAESEVDVAVIDAAWTMPDGGAPYLSIAEFVTRFGLPEVVAMTDGIGDGRIDRGLLVKALVDAQSIVDMHIGGRYAVPLETVPPIVEMWIADLARARLYPRGAPEGVAEQAKAVVRTLERIQSGAGSLPIDQAAPSAVSDTPILVTGGQRFYPDGIRGF